MEYTSMFWQHPRLPHSQPHPVHNGQRLFTAMSDPSVCGYSAVPITYAMEPVSIPPMYRIYPPMVRPNYRPYGRGRSKSTLIRTQNGPSCPNDSLGNGYSSLQENGWSRSVPMAYQNGDYASLPPTANMDNKESTEELSSEHRRYSDPGLGPANVPTNSKSEDTDSVDSGSSITTIGKSNKLFLTLIEQMTKLKETNSQLFKELHQTKSDLEIVKTELSQLKQSVPLEYQPGMLSDIIKEIRDASKIKEETMLSKMKLLMESQHFQKSVDVDQLKNQLEKMEREKAESEERIDKLEKKVATLRMSLNGESREIVAFEEENLALRRELQEARASRSLAEIQSTKCVVNLPQRRSCPSDYSPFVLQHQQQREPDCLCTTTTGTNMTNGTENNHNNNNSSTCTTASSSSSSSLGSSGGGGGGIATTRPLAATPDSLSACSSTGSSSLPPLSSLDELEDVEHTIVVTSTPEPPPPPPLPSPGDGIVSSRISRSTYTTAYI
ncbi:hypothetical protein QAD02_005326 [Eretmocerus hayati]|uniref:Uncharacterized protein n=1 Tax=Eretmocerus hayati TaxID=131215 RepID=A0ACC2NS30_9HYME|nr:hypothetical protein QAD02_005326 [Eretmocerus hayati]